jgi:hypothetical protein
MTRQKMANMILLKQIRHLKRMKEIVLVNKTDVQSSYRAKSPNEAF